MFYHALVGHTSDYCCEFLETIAIYMCLFIVHAHTGLYMQQEDDVMEQDKEEEEIIGPDGHKLDPNDPKALIAKASAAVDDEYESRKGSDKNYYQIAHTLREPVLEQPSMLAFGKLKAYQVCCQCDVGLCISFNMNYS